MVDPKMIPLDEASIRKEEIFMIPWLRHQFEIGYKLYRLRSWFTDYMAVKKAIVGDVVIDEFNMVIPTVLIESKEYMDRKNFYTAVLELVACEEAFKHDSDMDDYKVVDKIIVCKKFYNKIKSKTTSGIKVYDNATFKKILELFKIRVIEIGGNKNGVIRKEKG